MMKILYPTKTLGSVFELPVDALKASGIKGIIFDIDNTLVPYDEAEPTDAIITFFEQLREKGFKIALVSNNSEDRVIKFNERLKVLTLHKAQKPMTKSFVKALKMMECDKNEAIIVGDQVFTDIFGGNRAGIGTYLVNPVSDKDEWQTKVKRGLERQVLKQYKKWLERQA